MNQGDIQTFYPSTPGLGLNSHVEESGYSLDVNILCGVKPSRMAYMPPFWRTKRNAKAYDSDTGRFNDAMGVWHACREGASQGKLLDPITSVVVEPLVVQVAAAEAEKVKVEADAAAKAKTDAENKAKWEAATKSAYAGLSCDDMKKTYGITSKSWGSASDVAVGEFQSRCTVSGSSLRPGSGPDDSGVDQKAKNTKWIIIGVIAVVVIIVIALVVRAMRSKGKK